MEVGDTLVTLAAAWLTAALGGVVGPIVAGFIKRLWVDWKRNKKMVDAGAVAQRTAEQDSIDAAAADAARIRDEVKNTPPGDAERELTGWLQPRR